MCSPPLPTHPPLKWSRNVTQPARQELSKLLQKGVLILADPQTPGFYSHIFTIPKKNGEQRLIINLKGLNQCVPHVHFKMENIQQLQDMLLPKDWMVKIDLKEAYYSVPIHPQSQDLLRLWWDGKPFKFTRLPFGLSSAPRTFTKLLKPVVAFLREQGVRLIIYINDILIMADIKEKAASHLILTLDILEFLGFLINYEKSILEPTQRIEFLGFLVNSTDMTIALSPEKMQKFFQEAQLILGSQTSTARQLARMVGILSSCIPAVIPAPLYYRNLQAVKNNAVALGGYNQEISLPQPARIELEW